MTGLCLPDPGRRHGARTILSGLCVLAVAAPVLLGATSAQGATGSSSDLSVTSPPGPIDVTPGTVATTTLTVGNLGFNPLDVRIITERVKLLDNGKTRLTEGADPRFAGRVSITPSLLTLPARHEQTVNVSVNIPNGLKPDDYFLGFLISPIINSTSVTVENDIGTLVVLNVPGPRNRRLIANYVGLPLLNFSLSSSVSGLVRPKSVGTATVQFTTTMETSGWPTPTTSYRTEPPYLLPPGLTRDIPLHFSSWLGLGWYTVHTTLVYNLTDRTTGEVAISKTVVIINPLWFLVIPAILLFWMWVRRRRRSRSRPLHGANGLASSRRGSRAKEPVSVS